MTEDKTIKGNLYGVPVTATIKGKPDYAPTTEEVRGGYVAHWWPAEAGAAFDRWFAEELRKAKNDAWFEGFSASQRHVTAVLDGDERWDAKTPSPYRQGENSD